jgi:hypothetical protein
MRDNPSLMTAPFVRTLCGFRHGRPNTSDANDPLSVELGNELFARLGVAPEATAPAGVGNALTAAVEQDLKSRRSDLYVAHDVAAHAFGQYRHLGALQALRKRKQGDLSRLLGKLRNGIDRARELGELRTGSHARLLGYVDEIADTVAESDETLNGLLNAIGSESMLKLDVAVARPADTPDLEIALSAKWSLRTDRAQDCVSQGAKLASLRRGRMPHFALITIEPRPAMLALVADGSGSVDVVYHLALKELREAVAAIEKTRGRSHWSPAVTLDRLITQGRVRSYGDLVSAVAKIS